MRAEIASEKSFYDRDTTNYIAETLQQPKQMDPTSRESLELYLSPSRWNKRMSADTVVEHHVRVCAEYSEATQQNLKSELNIPYGENKAKINIFAPSSIANKEQDVHPPVIVFIHGGYWQNGSKDIYSFVADSVTKAGCIAVIVGHNLAPKASLDCIVSEIQTAVEFIAAKFPKSKLFLSGHSSGAHLCAMMLTTAWSCKSLIPQAIQGICLIGGIYDVVPLINTYVNDALKMNDEAAKKNSPQIILAKIAPSIKCPVVVVIEEHESPEFVRQAEEFVKILQSHGLQCSLVNVPDADHFSVIENLVDSEYCFSIVKALLPNSE